MTERPFFRFPTSEEWHAAGEPEGVIFTPKRDGPKLDFDQLPPEVRKSVLRFRWRVAHPHADPSEMPPNLRAADPAPVASHGRKIDD